MYKLYSANSRGGQAWMRSLAFWSVYQQNIIYGYNNVLNSGIHRITTINIKTIISVYIKAKAYTILKCEINYMCQKCQNVITSGI